MRKVKDYLQEFAKKYNIRREFSDESKIPENFDQLSIYVNYSDLRNTCGLSTLVLPKYRMETKASRYFIVCGIPNCKILYPYADEYWSFQGTDLNKNLFHDSIGIDNQTKYSTDIKRILNEHFRDVSTSLDFVKSYNNYLTEDYWKSYKTVRVSMPRIYNTLDYSSHPILKFYDIPDKKVFIVPMQYGFSNDNKKIKIPIDFYKYIIHNMTSQEVGVVCFQNSLTYDMAPHVKENSKVFLHQDEDFLKMMSMMKRTGFVVDFFSGISRLACIAQVPFLLFDERNRYISAREYEFEDLTCPSVPIFRNFYILNQLFGNTDLYVPVANNIINCVNQIDFTNLKHETQFVDRLDDYSRTRVRVRNKMGLSYFRKFKGTA
jgi:hypothetical protein